MSTNLTAIDLFAGAGGFSLAAQKQGFELLAAVEFDDKASSTYSHNLVDKVDGRTKVFNQDINDVDVHSLMKYQNIKQGELDLLLGGPPCQGFSTHRIKGAGISDPRNQLLIRYFDFVKALLPKVFLVENVPGLLWKRHEEHLNKFLNLAKSHGYQVINDAPIIVNAKDHGVPQNRKRAFILAVRKDICIKKLKWPPVATHFDPRLKTKPHWKTASTVFETPPKEILDKLKERLVEKKIFEKSKAEKVVNDLEFGSPFLANDPCDLHMKHTSEVSERFRETPLNGSREDISFRLKCHSKGYRGHKDVYGRVFFHTPSNTVTTGCNNPSKGRFVHPWLDHGITLRHAARLQSFPDDFNFLGSSTERARQIGNAVPIKLGKSLIKTIKSQILDTTSEM
ncbi:DNA cytosine methyltransferase [Psychromonas sp. L1A2]|uniref:DNA cytosine methyltransferase n=1 Tax=Psychromonas sp. L1A2 TaxID=2686356 RepID=UPI001357467A|nr:DNA cytosine methyltransferase [Psychromonas sp. L1A2]